MIELIRALSAADLRQIAAAIRARRLAPPYTAAALERHVSSRLAGPLAEALRRLSDDRLEPRHLALFLELLAAERGARAEPGEVADLVWTGPQTAGITNRDTSVVVRELFSHASSSVLVAGYVVYQGAQVFRALAERMDQLPELAVRMFLNIERRRTDTSLDSELVRRFRHKFRTKDWPGERLPELFYDPRSLDPTPARRASLHAKCVVVDEEVAFVSSANFTEAAQRRNVEAGVLIRSQRFAAKLAAHFLTLAEVGHMSRVR